MYIPTAFAETDLPKLHDFIEQNSFGLLVSQVDGLPFASHLPFLLERTCGTQGTLIGHMARANPQWEQINGKTALAIFSGPHAYISPTWYEAEQVVPTGITPQFTLTEVLNLSRPRTTFWILCNDPSCSTSGPCPVLGPSTFRVFL